MKTKPAQNQMEALLAEGKNTRCVGIRLTKPEYQELERICQTQYKSMVTPSRLAAAFVKNALNQLPN